MAWPVGREIIRSVYDSLEPGGVFVPTSDRVKILGRGPAARRPTWCC
jgi:hypothetical protein